MSLDVQLRVSPTPHTADAVTALRAAGRRFRCLDRYAQRWTPAP